MKYQDDAGPDGRRECASLDQQQHLGLVPITRLQCPQRWRSRLAFGFEIAIQGGQVPLP